VNGDRYDAVVLGGGFYGCKVAIALRTLGLKRVLLVEPNELGSAATTANQNRVHSGLHYPRSLVTAASAQKNYRRFLADHAPTIDANRRHVYGIAKDSKTSPEEFARLAAEIGAKADPQVGSEVARLFDDKMVEALYLVDEVTFDIEKMKDFLEQQLRYAGVEVIQGFGRLVGADDKGVDLTITTDIRAWCDLANTLTYHVRAAYLFNCTYAQLDNVGVTIKTRLKKEFTEVALCQVDHMVEPFHNTDITIMDGPFWSLMRYPSKDCHALTHVTFTPHAEWFSDGHVAPEALLATTHFGWMIGDAMRYAPGMKDAKYLRSLWTTRVVLADNENDDGRPVLWEYAPESPRVISILGSKFNSIYDVLDKLATGEWRKTSHVPSLRVAGRRALIGRGLVGTVLDQPGRFTDRYNSTNIEEMRGHYDSITIAAPSADKRWANNPATSDDDMDAILQLQDVLGRVTADHVTFISTIDASSQERYGQHRFILEGFIQARWPQAKILRLGALFGGPLKKNVIFDLLSGGDIYVRPDSTFQWYDLRRLWDDIQLTPEGANVSLHSAPVTVSWLLEQFGRAPTTRDWCQSKVVYNIPHETTSEVAIKEQLAQWIAERRKA